MGAGLRGRYPDIFQQMLSSLGIVAAISEMLSLLGSWVAAASTGAIAAWVLSFIRERWNRPVLEVEIDLERGSVVETSTVQEAQQKYARLVVHNRGRTLAKNCCGSVDYIKRTDPAQSHYVFRSDLIDLIWSLSHPANTVFHVPSRGYRLLDVGHTQISAEDFDANRLDRSIFCIDGARIPNRLTPEFRMNATYEMQYSSVCGQCSTGRNLLSHHTWEHFS